MTTNISTRPKGEQTLSLLEDALERLLEGKPKHTAADGKISMAKINKEAQQSRGAIYHYKEFVIEARKKITAYKENDNKPVGDDADLELAALKALKNEIAGLKAKNKKLKQDKEDAIELRNAMEAHANSVMAQYASIEQALMTKLHDIERLEEEKANLSKVINLQAVK